MPDNQVIHDRNLIDLQDREGICSLMSTPILPSKTYIFICTLFLSILVGSASLNAGVKLAWNKNTEPDVAGYQVYLGKESGKYTQIIDIGNRTSANIENLDPNTKYYCAVVAYDVYLEESPLSDEASFITPRNTGNTPDGPTRPSINVQGFEITETSTGRIRVVFEAPIEDGEIIEVYVSNDLEEWTLLDEQFSSFGRLLIMDPDAKGQPRRFYKLFKGE